MQAFGAVGMFITLTRECINGNIPECSSSSMYRVCHSGSSKSCSVINWEVARKLFFSFMLAGNGGKYWRNPNRFMTRFNAAIGIVVSCCCYDVIIVVVVVVVVVAVVTSFSC